MIVSAAILADGRAVRFGRRDKGSLIVDGRTIFERQVSELSQIASEILVVGGTTPRAEVSGSEPGSRPGVPVRAVADRLPGCGPLGGLYTALTEAQGDVTIVLACDMPLFDTRALHDPVHIPARIFRP